MNSLKKKKKSKFQNSTKLWETKTSNKLETTWNLWRTPFLLHLLLLLLFRGSSRSASVLNESVRSLSAIVPRVMVHFLDGLYLFLTDCWFGQWGYASVVCVLWTRTSVYFESSSTWTGGMYTELSDGGVKGTVHSSGSQLAQSKDPHFFLDNEVVTQNVLNTPF